MEVRCIKRSLDTNGIFIMNSDEKDWMDIGDQFIVYAIRIAKEATYYTVFNNNHLIEIPSQKFEIIKGKVYPEWEIRQDKYKELVIMPRLFLNDNFLENFSEWEEKERNEFEKLRISFEKSK